MIEDSRMMKKDLLEIDGVYEITDIGKVRLMHADNMAFLRWAKHNLLYKYFHVGIVDPPYGINVTSLNMGSTAAKRALKPKYERGNWDGEVPTQEYWDLLWYCCKNLIIWGGNYFTDKLGQTTLNEASTPIPPGRCFILWDKKCDGRSFAPGELALTTFDKNAIFIRRGRNALTEDETEKRHDTQKPVYLYDLTHLELVEKGHRVLDTHGGSFTHAIAAYKNDISLTIMDKQKSYYESGVKVLTEASNKNRLIF